jgi:release factor glutamine methyltransferase
VAAAKANAARLGLAERAAFRQGDWCQGIEERFDVILSNPPYIPTADIAALAPEVRLFDPALALDGGRDGLAAYRILARQIPSRLKAGGLAGLEAGAGQAPEIARLCQQAGLNIVGIKRDISGLERAVLVSA